MEIFYISLWHTSSMIFFFVSFSNINWKILNCILCCFIYESSPIKLEINVAMTVVGFLIVNYDCTFWSKSRALAMNVAKMLRKWEKFCHLLKKFCSYIQFKANSSLEQKAQFCVPSWILNNYITTLLWTHFSWRYMLLGNISNFL